MFGLFGRHGGTTEVTPAEVQRRLDAGERLFILDVREPAEYAEARLKDSTLIPLGQLAHRIRELPTDRTIVAICRSGNRSGVATDMLRRAGFTDVLNLKGGIIAWARSSLPIVRGR